MRQLTDELEIKNFMMYIEKINKIIKKIQNNKTKYQNVYMMDKGNIYCRDTTQIPSVVSLDISTDHLLSAKGKPTKAKENFDWFLSFISDITIKIDSGKLFEYIRDHKKTSVSEIVIDGDQLSFKCNQNNLMYNVSTTDIIEPNIINKIPNDNIFINDYEVPANIIQSLSEDKYSNRYIYLDNNGNVSFDKSEHSECVGIKMNIKYLPLVEKEPNIKIKLYKSKTNGVHFVHLISKDRSNLVFTINGLIGFVW